MKPIATLLRELSLLDVRLRVEGTALKIDAPKGALSAEVLAELKERKVELIELLRAAQAEQGPSQIAPAPADVSIPLTYSQRGLWFLDQLEGASTNYNLPSSVSIRGRIDVEALQNALTALIGRHEILRTVFPLGKGHEPFQKVLPAAPVTLPLIDLSRETPEKQVAQVQALKDIEANFLFDLAQGPLLRAQLILLGDQSSELLLTLHHIISDGWSISVMVRELCAHYQAFAEQGATSLPPLEIQYGDYAYWQNERIQSGSLNPQLDFWKRQLDGIPALIQLPTDFLRPPTQSLRGKKLPVSFSPAEYAALKGLAQRMDSTEFMVLHAAFAVLLAHYTGMDDIVIGTVVAGRQNRQLENLVGFFVNTMALRLNLSGNPSFERILASAKSILLAAAEHQDVSFEQVVETLNPDRNLAYHPVFQVLLVLQNTPPAHLSLDGLEFELKETANDSSKFDLLLDLKETDGQLTGSFEYSTDLFREETALRMLRHLKHLIVDVAERPQTPLWEINLMAAEEVHALLHDWNQSQTEIDLVQDALLGFEAQVSSTPDLLAMRHLKGAKAEEQQEITYAALNARANQLAHRLLEMGIQKNQRVGICIDRSIDLVTAILGVWKAGAAFVGLDPTYPSERMRYMLEDSDVSILLSEQKYAATLAVSSAPKCWLDDPATFAGYSQANPALPLDPQDTAYIIYTSGSTGKPKGIIMSRLGISNWIVTQIALSKPAMTTFQLASICFDVCYQEIFATFNTGGLLLSIEESLRHEPFELLRIIQDHGVARLFLPFVRLQQLAEVGCEIQAFPSCLDEIYSAGEQLQVTPAIETFFHHCGARLYNQYGPSEVPICTHYTCEGPASTWPRLPSIGSPLPNNYVYLLNPARKPVPMGVIGEYFLGGYNTASGYLGKEELTREKFIPNPFEEERAPVLYRSGDMGRMLPDGNFEFWGRIDKQVKIRGFRVELGEIENVLYQHHAVKEAVIQAKTTPNGRKYLAAFVVYHAGQTTAWATLRDYLQAKLPDYMIPEAYLELEALPTDPNGKVNGRLLDTLKLAQDGHQAEYVPPATPLEKELAAIWEAVLDKARIGLGDNFFELGGHSLLATQVASRIRSQFGIELPVRTIFTHPTIGALAPHVEAAFKTEAQSLPPIRPSQAGESRFPLSFAQTRLWLLDQLDVALAYNIPFALSLAGELDEEIFLKSFQYLIDRHDILRTVFKTQEGNPVQEVWPTWKLELIKTDLSMLTPPEQHLALQRHVETAALHRFDLGALPLFRLELLCMQPQRWTLLLTFHHIIFDGWSLGVLVKEFSETYRLLRQGQAWTPAPLHIQYADYAVWQRTYVANDYLKRLENYWQAQFKTQPDHLQLPADLPVPNVRTPQGAMWRSRLDPHIIAELEQLGNAHQGSLFMGMLAAFYAFLQKQTQQDDIVIGTPIANRNQIETEPLIGFFVNALPLRNDLSDDPAFTALLKRTRELALNAYAHQDLPYERLVETLTFRRDLDRTPLFNVLFVMQNAPVETLELPGLQLQVLDQAGVTAKYDLTLVLEQRGTEWDAIWEYSTDLFSQPRIQQLAHQFEHLLQAIVTDPLARLSNLPLADRTASAQQLRARNQTQRDYPRTKSLGQLFKTQAQKTPYAIALRTGTTTWTYQELDDQSDRIALWLLSQERSDNPLVGLFMERSPLTMAAILGIVKAGMAYLPLPTEYPAARLLQMLEDARPARILTTQARLHLFPAQEAPLMAIEQVLKTPISEPGLTSLERLPVSPEAMCYLMYTSGSTGVPKGVMVPHRAVARLALSSNYAHFEAGNRFLLHSPLAFDASTLEIWACLLNGGELVISETEKTDPAALAQLISNQGIDVLWLTAGLFNVMVEQRLPVLAGVKYLLAGGEALSLWHVNQYLALPQKGILINGYGPTENTTFSCCHVMTEPLSATTVPIGKPIGNSRAYLLDAHHQPVPEGVAGELYLAGDGLALGYWNDPVQTAAKFIPDPFAASPSLMYRSGDWGRYLSDGTIEFLGRRDEQVKIRGHRIELGEVKRALQDHVEVLNAVVIVHEKAALGKLLLAFWVKEPEGEITEPTLMEDLRKRLPPYMLPNFLIQVDSIPLTANGKTDRNALLTQALDRFDAPQASDLPTTASAQQLAALWERLLDISPVGLQSDFFQLGGHSLLATQLAYQIREHFQVAFTLKDVFEFPRLQQQLDVIEKAQSQPLVSESIPRVPRGQYRQPNPIDSQP